MIIVFLVYTAGGKKLYYMKNNLSTLCSAYGIFHFKTLKLKLYKPNFRPRKCCIWITNAERLWSEDFYLSWIMLKVLSQNHRKGKMRPRIHRIQTTTSHSNQYISTDPIIQTGKYETWSDLWHRPFIMRVCSSYQMNEETSVGSRHFSHLGFHLSSKPFIIFSVDAFLSLHLP